MKHPANGTKTRKNISVRRFRLRMELPEGQQARLHSTRHLHGVREHAVNHVIDRLPAGPLQRSSPNRPISFDHLSQNALNPLEHLGVFLNVHGAIFVYDPVPRKLARGRPPHHPAVRRAALDELPKTSTGGRRPRNDSSESVRGLDRGESRCHPNGVPVGELTISSPS